MDKKTIIYLTDFDTNGSGYKNIAIPLLTRMYEEGHEVIVLGISYNLLRSNNFPFHLVPCMSLKDTAVQLKRISSDIKVDALIVAADLMWQKKYIEYFEQFEIDVPYYALFPVESPPVAFSWLLPLTNAKKLFCMSKFGADACTEMGFDTTFLPIGLDTSFWFSPEDKSVYREMLRRNPQDIVILTVADNQERKNLLASMDIVKGLQDKFKENSLHVNYFLVTREKTGGYALRDYAYEIGLSNFEIVERGIPLESLREFYWGADLFLLTSKAEGLGMPVLESMASGLTVAGTNACAIAEHLEGGKNGIPLPFEYSFRDSYNNGLRYLVDTKAAVSLLYNSWLRNKEWKPEKDPQEYLSKRSFDISYEMLMKGLFDE